MSQSGYGNQKNMSTLALEHKIEYANSKPAVPYTLKNLEDLSPADISTASQSTSNKLTQSRKHGNNRNASVGI